MVRAVVDVAQQRGVSPLALLGEEAHALYLEPAERAFSRDWFNALLTRAAQLTNEPAFGLLCGIHACEPSFGLMAPLVAHAPTMRRALELVVQFQPLLLEGLRLRLSEGAGVAQLRCHIEQHVITQRSLPELVVAGLVRMLQSFGCARHEIREVCFEHTRPAYYPSYTLAFAGAERFAMPFTGVEFTAVALDRPHLNRHSELHSLVLGQAEHHLRRLSRPLSYTERVRALMAGGPGSQLPSMLAAARELGISARTLRRHLEQEGTSFRELTQAALHDLARVRLRDPAMTLQAIAHELGFSDATAFHRAFRRWSKLTPAEYRDAFLGARDDDAAPTAAQSGGLPAQASAGFIEGGASLVG